MKVKGRENADWSARKAQDGWHMVMFEEGIDFLKDQDGNFYMTKPDSKGNSYKRLSFPTSIKEDGEDDGIRVSNAVSVGTDFGEQRVADLLAATGLFAAFEKNFPEDASFWDENVLNAIKSKLPGKFCKMRLETNSKSGYQNVVELAKADATVSNKEKKTKATGGAGKADVAVPAPSSDWD